MSGKSTNLSRRISIAAGLMIIISMATLGTISFLLYRSDSINQNGKTVMLAAEAAALTIDPIEYRKAMESHEETEVWQRYKAYFDTLKRESGFAYIYVIDAEYSDTEVTYFLEGIIEGEEPVGLGGTEDIEAFDEGIFETLRTGVSGSSDVYDLGGFGPMVSGYAPIKDENGRVLAAVGADLGIETVFENANAFGLQMLIIALAFSVVFGALALWFARKYVGAPVRRIASASEQIARGDLDVDLNVKSNDEIGLLADSFKTIVDNIREQLSVLSALAQGDLTGSIAPRGERDEMNSAIERTIDNLNDMMNGISAVTNNVASGARQLSSGAQQLAQGSTEQASSVEELSSAITAVAEQTRHNARMAESAAKLADRIRQSAQTGSAHMERMVEAVSEINDASSSISKVIKVIDDIAFQTNILALNAAVEAARAGQHGKGFAVVAEEVRNLAQKSAEAAKNTGELIANSVEKASFGTSIAKQTAASLSEIVEGINESSRIVSEIASSSENQSAAIAQINVGIDQVAQVVAQNSATAQEAAAASADMSSESENLHELVARFALKDEGAPRLGGAAERMRLGAPRSR